MYKSNFFKDKKLPFVESRYTVDSTHNYSPHLHNTLSIGAIENGEVAYTCKNKYYLLRPNELAIINPQIIHACNPIKNKARTYHMMYIDPIWCKEVQEDIFGKLDTFLEINIPNIIDKQLFDNYINLNYLLLNKNTFYLEKEEALQFFFYKLFKKYCHAKLIKVEQVENYKEKITQAKKYILKNIYSNLTLEDIGKHIGFSKFHFLRVFKKITFITPHAYLINQKIDYAKKLLNNGNAIIDVAMQMGFVDQSHFNKVFKSIVAATPNEYQKDMNK